jgi:hypothetical protein
MVSMSSLVAAYMGKLNNFGEPDGFLKSTIGVLSSGANTISSNPIVCGPKAVGAFLHNVTVSSTTFELTVPQTSPTLPRIQRIQLVPLLLE